MSTSFLSHYLSTPRRAVSGRINHVVVVGAGLSGLSAAVLLAGSGRSVTVVEKARGDRDDLYSPGRCPRRHGCDGGDDAVAR